MTRRNLILCTCLLCLLSLLSRVAAQSPWTIAEDKDKLLVTVQNKTFRLNRKLTPSWGGFDLATYGDKMNQSFSPVVKCSVKSAAPVWIVPSSEKVPFEILRKDDQRLTIRGRYALRNLDGAKETIEELSMVVCYQFINGLPAMAADLILLANSDRISVAGYSVTFTGPYDAYMADGKTWTPYKKGSWNNIRSTKPYILTDSASQHMLLSPVGSETPNRTFSFSTITDWKPLDMNAKDATAMSLLVGYPDAGNPDRMMAFRNSLKDKPQTLLAMKAKTKRVPGEMEVGPAEGAVHIGKFDSWENVPIFIRRNQLANYRPSEANNWKGPKDLSFTAQAVFDKTNMYLRIRVTDNQVIQPTGGYNMWVGDCIQIGFDPLNVKALSPDFMLIGISPGPKPNLCGWSHPNPKYQGQDISHIITSATRLTADGYDCEMAIPWDFLKPFDLKNGQMGFNIVVLDKNGGNWMGITDGIAGGKAPEKYRDLRFIGFEEGLYANQQHPQPELLPAVSLINAQSASSSLSASVFVNEKDLPAQLLVKVEDQVLLQQDLASGFNSWTMPAKTIASLTGPKLLQVFLQKNGKKLYQKDYPITFITRSWLAQQQQITRDELKAFNETCKAVTAKFGKEDTYLRSKAAVTEFFIKHLDAVLKNDETYSARFRMGYTNLHYVRNLMKQGQKDAASILNGKKKLINIPAINAGSHPEIRNGGFYVNGRETFFIGPNTWEATANATFTDIIGRSGLNFVNYFNMSRLTIAEREAAIKTMEDRGVFFNLGDWLTADDNFLATKGPDEPLFDRLKNTPNLLFLNIFAEDFGYPKDRDILFKNYLMQKYGSIDILNRKVNGKLKSFEDIKSTMLRTLPGLDYESYVYWMDYYTRQLPRGTKTLHQRWSKPLSSHVSELMFYPYDALGNFGDLDIHWKYVDMVSFDAGTEQGATRNYALDFTGRFLLMCDMGRSFYPEKPIANNEEYTIPVSDLTINVPEIYHHTAALLPILHGRNVTSVFLFNPYLADSHSNTTWDRADGFYQTAQALLHANQHPEAFAAFRTLNNQAAILYSVPSYADKEYANYIIDAYEGLNFGPSPCRFISEQRINRGDLSKFKILFVTNAQYTTDKTFNDIMDFARNGGKVLAYGNLALAMDPYGKVVPQRKELIAKYVTALPDGAPKTYFNALYNALKDCGLKDAPAITSPDGKPVFGVETRESVAPDSTKLLYAVNLLHTPQTIKLPAGTWHDLLQDATLSGTYQLKSLELILLKKK